MRLNKFLQEAGVGSRREAERLVLAGAVQVNGVVATATTPVADGDVVLLRGQPVRRVVEELPRVFLYHKPVGVIVSTRDHAGRKTLYEALTELDPQGTLPRLMPVGRVDLNSEGLLLLTTDGRLAQTLMSPATALPRRYRVRVFGGLSDAQLAQVRKGVTIDDVWYRGADIELEKAGESGKNRWYGITLTEGKNREIRKIFAYFKCEVNRLIRVRYGPFEMTDLPKNTLREVPAAAVRDLLASLSKDEA